MKALSFLAFVDCFINCSNDFAVDCYNRAFSCPVAKCLTALLKCLTVLLEYFDLSVTVCDVTQK